MEKPRLGHIKFINCLPLAYSLQYGGFAADMEVCSDVPSSLNNQIVNGRLDVSPVSSIVYARHHEKLFVIPNVSISANGALQSILLVSKHPIESLNNAKVALTAKSETSHCLLKIVLHDAYQANPDYFITDLSTETEVLNDADAVLFIGDDALYHYHHRHEGLYYYDVGAEWKKLTGLPMVYAVWVTRREFARQSPVLLQTAYERVTGGFQYGLDHLEQAIAVYVDKLPFSAQQVHHYLTLLNWSFTSDHERALLTFYERAYHIGLIEKVPAIEFAEVKK